MTTTIRPGLPIAGLKSIILLLLLTVAGLAGNHFRYPIFLNIDFLFGSIFAMLALQFLGFTRGVIAAALIASSTYIIWNHPYAIIIMTAEAAFVGWLVTSRRLEPVLADALYWVFIGIPLVYIFYHLVMNTTVSSTMIVMSKQAVNGIANALVARLLFTGYLLRFKVSQISFREILSNLLVFFVLCPALLMLGVGSRSDFTEIDHNIKESLIQDNQRLTLNFESWIAERKNSLTTLAGIAATINTSEIQSRLEQTHASDFNFDRISLQDSDAIAIGFSPVYDELGNLNIGRNFSDRPFISTLKQTLRPMLSEVIMGKVGIPRPRVLILAPVVIRGKYGGYVAGTLNFNHIQNILESYAGTRNLLYTLIDKNGSIIATNRTDQKIMNHFARGKGELRNLDETISQWIPVLPGNISIMEQWKNSFYITESHIGKTAEWKFILEQPVAPFQKVLYDRYSKRLVLLFVLILFVLALAELVGRRAVRATEDLGRLTRDMPARIPYNEPVIWPDSSIMETSHLIVNFREMSEALTAVFEETRHINKVLEQQVDERTRDFRMAKEDADAANMAKSRFLSVVAHEFRTPLGLLTVSVDILDRYWERLDKEKRAEQHEQIRSAAQQISHLVDSVLAYNRQGVTLSPPLPVLLDIVQVCRSLSAEVNAVWNVEHNFKIDISPECGKFMFIESLFRRMLENLLTNAFRFTPPGGYVSLNVRRSDEILIIEVADTGIGIPENEQKRIFDSFYRCGNVEGRSGLGLGLSITSEAVQQMNGTIALTSSVGEGTTFRVTLPLMKSSGGKQL